MKNLFDLQRFGQYLVRAGLAFLIAYLLFSILGPYLVAWGVEADKSGMLIGSIMQYLGTQFQAFYQSHYRNLALNNWSRSEIFDPYHGPQNISRRIKRYHVSAC